MSHDKVLTRKKLSELWRDEGIPVLEISGNKYAIFSDIHLGNGNSADDLRFNKQALMRAFNYYTYEGYSLIFLGDIEELWQFELHEIIEEYNNTIYAEIRAFGDEQIHRVFGNHDIDWKTLSDPVKNNPLKHLCATEALKMKDEYGKTVVLLLHGHQGDVYSDKKAWSSRFFVRLYRWIEPFFKIDYANPSSKSCMKKDFEQILYSWAKEFKVILICGHSHRAVFASKAYVQRLEEEIKKLKEQIYVNKDDKKKIVKLYNELKKRKREYKNEKKWKRDIPSIDPKQEPLPCFFNTGCALYPGGVTVIEIVDDMIKLVKWHRNLKEGKFFKVYHEENLKKIINEVIK